MANPDRNLADDGSIVDAGAMAGAVAIAGEPSAYALLASSLCLCHRQKLIGCFRAGSGRDRVECGDRREFGREPLAW